MERHPNGLPIKNCRKCGKSAPCETEQPCEFFLDDPQAKITKEELIELFGETMPWEVYDLIFVRAGDDMTIGQLRAKIRAFAATLKSETPEDRLRIKIVEILRPALDPCVPHVRVMIDKIVALAKEFK